MPYTEPWKLVILDCDPSTERVAHFFENVWSDGIMHIVNQGLNGPSTKKKNVIKDTEPISRLEGKILIIYGDGIYHHYTYGLCTATAYKKSKDYIYVHTDNHTDAGNHGIDGYIGCGSFVEDIIKGAGAKDALLLGPTHGSNELKRTHIDQPTLASEKAEEALRDKLKEKLQKDVYASFDLDVMHRTEIITSYGQGMLELKHLLKIIEVINEEKNVISADILGLSSSTSYRLKSECLEPVSLLTYAALAAKITGKDTKELEKLQGYFKNKKVYADDLRERVLLREEFRKITEQLKI